MNSQLIYWFFFLVLVTGLSQSEAAEPIAEFDAARVIAKSGWTAENDKPHRAEVTTDGGALRIADEESDGQLEDAYLYFELTKEQRAEARSSGFVYEWSLRIPKDTGGCV